RDAQICRAICCVLDCIHFTTYEAQQMTTTLSVRIDSATKKQLEALAKRARRSKSFLAAEAIAAYVEAESWQLDEVQAGLQELDQGRAVAHGDVSKWLRSWGKKRERKAPRACRHRGDAAFRRTAQSSPAMRPEASERVCPSADRRIPLRCICQSPG